MPINTPIAACILLIISLVINTVVVDDKYVQAVMIRASCCFLYEMVVLSKGPTKPSFFCLLDLILSKS